jgi:hypothetical protein
MRENSDFVTKINEINVELSENFQRYVNESCESESDGKTDGFGAGCLAKFKLKLRMCYMHGSEQ